MKTKIIEKEPEFKLPSVGQVWHHKGDPTIYLRISDSDGRLVFAHDGGKDVFYSVNLSSGTIEYTGKNVSNIILLQPIGGEAQFEEVSR